MTITVTGNRVHVSVRPQTVNVNVAKGGMTINRLSTNDPQPIGTAADPGEGPNASAEDHVHALPFATVKTVLEAATADIGLNARRLRNVLDPQLAQDVATKAYVDANGGGGGGGGVVSPRIVLDGDTTLDASQAEASYTNDGAADTIVATLPTSAAIGSLRWRARFIVVAGQILRFATQGADVLAYYGITGPSLESATIDDVIEVEYAGNGRFVVASAAGQGWVFP